MTDTPINRESLRERLHVSVQLSAPDEREKNIRVGVDNKLAKLFGAKYFAGCDWNLFSRPSYTLSDIEEILQDNNLPVRAEEIIKESFFMDRFQLREYAFRKVTNKKNEEIYRLIYLDHIE